MGKLENQVAIITGAGRGIGAGIARRFAEEGARLVLCSRTEKQIADLADEIGPLSGGAMAVPVDVTSQAEIDSCVKDTLETFGRIDIVVNGAGTQYISSVALSDPNEWLYDINVNLVGAYRFCRTALPALAASKNGRIVNIASRMGNSPGPLNSAYAASKAGLIAFTTSLASEVARDGIHVNAICPAFVETKLLYDSMIKMGKLTGQNVDEIRNSLAERSMLRRAVTTEEVAALAIFLVTEATGITGQSINITAGAHG
ncbi:MAG: SDR family oxidoreductase [Gemmatimonadetes bacterium]|nr:SDR family oxidoreductase [Gemmatimonadota bacterium]